MRYTNGYYASWDQSFAEQLLETFNLDISLKIKELSRGMRAQVALVAAVAHRPELLILDEPSSGLDAVVRGDILDAIVRAVSEEGRTVIFSSHLLEEVERMSDHVTMLHGGQVALEGTLEHLESNYHCSDIRFNDPLEVAPNIETVLTAKGGGRSWSVTHQGSIESLQVSVKSLGGEVVETRHANLEEIFIARVGRRNGGSEAA